MIVYLVNKKKTAVIRLSGTRASAYQEMYNLRDLGYQPVNKTKYERTKKQLRMPQKASES